MQTLAQEVSLEQMMDSFGSISYDIFWERRGLRQPHPFPTFIALLSKQFFDAIKICVQASYERTCPRQVDQFGLYERDEELTQRDKKHLAIRQEREVLYGTAGLWLQRL